MDTIELFPGVDPAVVRRTAPVFIKLQALRLKIGAAIYGAASPAEAAREIRELVEAAAA